MANPFRLRWLDGWTFQTVLMEGSVQVEARGFGICLRTSVLPGETPRTAADRLVLEEDRRRRSLHNAWLRGQAIPENPDLSTLPGASLDLPSPPGSDRSDQEASEVIPPTATSDSIDAAAADHPPDRLTAADREDQAADPAIPEASNVVRPRDSQLSRSFS